MVKYYITLDNVIQHDFIKYYMIIYIYTYYTLSYDTKPIMWDGAHLHPSPDVRSMVPQICLRFWDDY